MAYASGCDILYLIRHELPGSRKGPLDGLAAGAQNLTSFSPFLEDSPPTLILVPHASIVFRSSLRGTC